jgi:hypothetical protein
MSLALVFFSSLMLFGLDDMAFNGFATEEFYGF